MASVDCLTNKDRFHLRQLNSVKKRVCQFSELIRCQHSPWQSMNIPKNRLFVRVFVARVSDASQVAGCEMLHAVLRKVRRAKVTSTSFLKESLAAAWSESWSPCL
jgi:hypothetical protein